MEKTYLAADAISGVYKVNPQDYKKLELMLPRDFLKELAAVSGDEIILAAFDDDDDDIYTKIDKTYGVHG